MKKSEIRVGGIYVAKVSNNLTTVRVDAIREIEGKTTGSSYWKKTTPSSTVYDVTNLKTERKTTFRSAMKFRREVVERGTEAYKALKPNTITSKCKSCGINIVVEPASFGPSDYCMPCSQRQPLQPGESQELLGAEMTAAKSRQEEKEKEKEKENTPVNPTVVASVVDSTPHSSPASAAVKPVGRYEQGPSPLAELLQRSIDKVNAEKVAKGEDNAPHLIIEARAGTGKTTTLIEGLKRVKGISTTLVPSPQQSAVWESMELSKGKVSSICFVAFNKSIATELQQRVPAGCDAMTMHSMGFKAVTKALGRMEPNQYVVQDIICELTDMSIHAMRASKPTVLKATEDLVSLCKMNLTEAIPHVPGFMERDCWNDQLDNLARHYDVDLNHSRAEVFALVPRVLERCKTPKGKISFDDMIWLPIVLNLPISRYDLLLVDEAQDLNRCQQALAKRAGKRLILCGDPKQAIYGFAGADSESMSRMAKELGHVECMPMGPGIPQPRGCITLPLTVTRRCGKAIVREANKYVPDFEAFESNPEGKISHRRYKGEDIANIDGTGTDNPSLSYRYMVEDGDMILCRVNAPLVSQCFKFLKAGRKANIQGRDIGAGLVSTIKKLKATTVVDLVAKVDEWLHKESEKENAKRQPNEARLIALQDRADCLTCFTEGLDTVEAVIAKVESIFTDSKDSAGIRLSSVHKAKGLEAKRVFILQPKGAEMPHPMAKSKWQVEQEYNLLYVAITRAIEELVYVS